MSITISSATEFYSWCVMMVLSSLPQTHTLLFFLSCVCVSEAWKGEKAGGREQRKSANGQDLNDAKIQRYFLLNVLCQK